MQRERLFENVIQRNLDIEVLSTQSADVALGVNIAKKSCDLIEILCMISYYGINKQNSIENLQVLG